MGCEVNEVSKEEIRNLKRKLADLGIYPSYDGFDYITRAVKILRQDKVKYMTLYRVIAALHRTTPSRVERAIRHAISVAWNKNSISEKYTVSEFLSLLAEDLL